MILTGKAKEDFLKYFRKRNKISIFNSCENIFNKLDILYKTSLIIDFFDTKGIYISDWSCEIVDFRAEYDASVSCGKKNYGIDGWHTTRQEAISKAIEKANEIYNGKH